jgi:hypothetical protein
VLPAEGMLMDILRAPLCGLCAPGHKKTQSYTVLDPELGQALETWKSHGNWKGEPDGTILFGEESFIVPRSILLGAEQDDRYPFPNLPAGS